MNAVAALDRRRGERALQARMFAVIGMVAIAGVLATSLQVFWSSGEQFNVHRIADLSALSDDSARANAIAAGLAREDANGRHQGASDLKEIAGSISSRLKQLDSEPGPDPELAHLMQRHAKGVVSAVGTLVSRVDDGESSDRIALAARALDTADSAVRTSVAASIRLLSTEAEASTSRVRSVAIIGGLGIVIAAGLLVWLVLRPTLLQARQLNEASEESQRRAMDAVEHREQLLIKVSRDVRTPMMSVLGYSDMLLEPTLSAPQRADIVGHIRRSTRHLLALVHDILDHAAAGAGRLSIKKTPCSPEQILREIVAMLRPLASSKKLALSEQIDASMPAGVLSDPHRLSQVLFSLLGNAIKFTSKGEVVVRAFVDHTDTSRLTFEIRDTGKGMTPEQLRAYGLEADRDEPPVTPPTMGLSLAQWLARLLGGRIVAESTLGTGSVFRFTIPNEVATLPSIATRGKDVAVFPLLVGNVLVAEDSTDSQKLIAFYLRKLGLESTLVSDGQKAIDTALEAARIGNPYNMILMDMQMPNLDGYEATKKLREAGYKGVIVALTANALAGDREKCIAAGCDDYLTKPIERETFIETCTRLLGSPNHVHLRLAA